MKRSRIMLALSAATLLTLPACEKAEPGNPAAAADDKGGESTKKTTIAAGLGKDSRFMAAAKAAGIDATLAGPGPYTVFVPDDAAFGKLPQGEFDAMLKPESRARLTRVITYHILPGTVLAEDIGKAIDAGKGKAALATMGGQTLTATREDGKIMLTDGSGGKATVARADETLANGVVHRIDTVMRPGESAS
jgi:uncharacterized surface protein with fasciclin (FAS1) repeats